MPALRSVLMSVSPPRQEAADIDSVQPFQLVKFFSFTGLAVFLVFTIAFSLILSNYAKKYLMERSEAYALVLAENLNHQVFTQFVIPTVLRYGQIGLRNQEQYELLDRIVKNTIHGLNIEAVTIFDSKENIISYSTNSELRGKEDVGGKEYKLALAGKNNSVLESNGSLLHLFPGGEIIFCRLKTYIPFRQERQRSEGNEGIMGVIEIVQNLSGDLEAIIQFQGILIGSAVVIMTTLFVVLYFIVARADRIIEARSKVRRHLEEQLNQAERLAGLGKMVASVSHEIKNPLGIVRSTAEILRKRVSKVAPGNEQLADIIIEETTRLDGIVREFLDFARPQQPRLGPLQVNSVVDKACQFLQPEVERFKVQLRCSMKANLPDCRADGDLIYRALLNILLNGLQAMENGGRLEVESYLSTDGESVAVRISDTGCGMSPEVKAQIFQPFFTEKHRGTGLGLAIVKNIVDSHGGSLEVESFVGEGTIFILKLPLWCG